MKWLIWSTSAGGWWWKESCCGCTTSVQEAGRYTLAEAVTIVARSAMRRTWITGLCDVRPAELIVPAPENLPAMIEMEKR